MAGKILGLDLGDKKVGIAISDDSKQIAFPREVKRFLSFDNFIDELRFFCKKENIDKIIIGLPLSLNGKETEQTKKIALQAERIKKELNIEIEFVDERLTSKQAEKISLTQKKKYRKMDKDDIAAQKILQTYLDQHCS